MKTSRENKRVEIRSKINIRRTEYMIKRQPRIDGLKVEEIIYARIRELKRLKVIIWEITIRSQDTN